MSPCPPLALLGAAPAFDHPLPVGQLNFPDWDSYADAMRGIFERQYYTNHGPMVQALESAGGVDHAAAFFGVGGAWKHDMGKLSCGIGQDVQGAGNAISRAAR